MSLISNKINYKKAIQYATGRDLPLGGGTGLTINDPILVTENHHGSAVETERFAAKEIAVLNGWWEAEFGKITLFEHNGRNIEEFIIECVDDDDKPREKKLYFDITDGFSNIRKTLEQIKTPEELEQIYNGSIYSAEDKRLHWFHGAYSYARTLRPGERLNADFLMRLHEMMLSKSLKQEDADKLIDALEDCGYEVER